MNQVSSHARSSSDSAPGSHTTIPASPSWRRSATHPALCASSSRFARSLTTASCWLGVRPSGDTDTTPSRAMPIRPATRTEKNSSRFDALIDRNRNRSSSGWRAFSASSTTRPLKSSHDSSRLMNLSGSLGPITTSVRRTSAASSGTARSRRERGGETVSVSIVSVMRRS